MIEKEPFRSYKLEEKKKKDIFSVRINAEERQKLDKAKLILEQPKDSTAFKQLALIGYIVIHNGQTRAIIEYLFKNKRNNQRQGIADFD